MIYAVGTKIKKVKLNKRVLLRKRKLLKPIVSFKCRGTTKLRKVRSHVPNALKY